MKIEPWSVVFFLGFIAYVTIRGIFESRSKGEAKVVMSQPGGQDWILILLMAIGGMILPLVYLFTPLLGFADYDIPNLLSWLGLVVMLMALWLFWRSHADLGKNWSRTIELREGHRLITRGVYRRVRHPMYAAIWLFSFAQVLLLQNWIAGWSAFVAFAVMYFARVRREERMMKEFLDKNMMSTSGGQGDFFLE